MHTEPALTILSWALLPLQASFGLVTAPLARSGLFTWPFLIEPETTEFLGAKVTA